MRSVGDVPESRTNLGPKGESSVVILPAQDWCGTAEVMSSNVSVVQRLSRPYRAQFCSRPWNPAMNHWAILIRSLRDRTRVDSCPWCPRFLLNANPGECTRPYHTTPRRGGHLSSGFASTAQEQWHARSPNSTARPPVQWRGRSQERGVEDLTYATDFNLSQAGLHPFAIP